MNPYAPQHHQEEMERANRRMSLLMRIADLRKVIAAAEGEGAPDFVIRNCKHDITLHEEQLEDLRWESGVQLKLF